MRVGPSRNMVSDSATQGSETWPPDQQRGSGGEECAPWDECRRIPNGAWPVSPHWATTFAQLHMKKGEE